MVNLAVLACVLRATTKSAPPEKILDTPMSAFLVLFLAKIANTCAIRSCEINSLEITDDKY